MYYCSASLLEGAVAKILRHQGLPTRPPTLAPACASAAQLLPLQYLPLDSGVVEGPLISRARPEVQPNPFPNGTVIRFELSRESQVALELFDAGGLVVRTLIEGSRGPGRHGIDWDGRDPAGRSVVSGVLYARISTDG